MKGDLMTICKYHGRSCDAPERCERFHPQKYNGDGHNERIDPDRLTIGCVVRMPYRDGGIPAFDDSCVTDIVMANQYTPDVALRHYPTLEDALKDAEKHKGVDVFIKVARPYMTVQNIGGITSPLIGIGTVTVQAWKFLEHYKVVAQSTGAYATLTM